MLVMLSNNKKGTCGGISVINSKTQIQKVWKAIRNIKGKDYEWNIHEDLCGSDHFLVILTSNVVKEETAPNRWIFKKADWLSFQAQCSSELTEVCRGSRRSVY